MPLDAARASGIPDPLSLYLLAFRYRHKRAAKDLPGMKSFQFDPEMTFTAARRRMIEVSDSGSQGHIAKLIWRDGPTSGDSLTYLWDPLAERFGHNIDKEPIDHAISQNLLIGLAVEVQVLEYHGVKRGR